MKFGFVILHYKAYDVTKACIDSILSLNGSENAFTAVVDNASGNGSAEALQSEYENEKNVKVIFRENNDGFSRGNNCGYKYLAENFAPDIIIIANNDVVFNDADTLCKLEKIYNEENFYVLGPDIINPHTQEHQNPIRKKAYTMEEISSEVDKNRAKLKHLGLLCAVKSVKNALLPKKLDTALKKKLHSAARELDPSVRQENVCLFGACQIFSKNFILREEKPYYPETHFYYEEDILFARCAAAGMKVVYRPDLSVFHMENASTRAANKGLKAHMRFKLENLVEAGQLYRDYISAGKA